MHPRKKKLIEKIKKKNINKPLVFIHTPKCAGTYIKPILQDLKIENRGHHLANPEDDVIYFTVIRDPVDRLESFLNYRLGHKVPRVDWPDRLYQLHYDKTIPLNQIVEELTDVELKSFSPYKTLEHWTSNVHICLEISELKEFLEMFGYTYDESKYLAKNVSKKTRGALNNLNRKRIHKLYKKDVEIFNKWTRDFTTEKKE